MLEQKYNLEEKSVIAISLPPSRKSWTKMSFASTLYLYPILDILLTPIPCSLHDEVRLGLQEALVNAAKHGNELDPNKTICVQFSITKEALYWIISDQGFAEMPESNSQQDAWDTLPPQESENGRGLCILKQVFDQVFWDGQNSQLKLRKEIKKEQINFWLN